MTTTSTHPIDLSRFPRVRLAHLPTPLEPLDRLSEHLGGPRIWIKRDDCTGLATGGNKTRKLEFLLGEALAQGADTVITFGALQSNHARQTAAACAKLGLECHLVLTRVVPRHQVHYEQSGNILLDRLLGANLHVVAPGEVSQVTDRLRTQLERDHRRVYVIPAGGSNATGALGYVQCAHELRTQADKLKLVGATVTHASSSGGTQAGIAIGLNGSGIALLGINVSDADGTALHDRIAKIVDDVRSLSRMDSIGSIHIRNEFLGPAYGLPTKEALEATELIARMEGILCDPVYTGKALAGSLAMIRTGELDPRKPLIFLHTGGVSALSAYSDAF